MSQTLYSIDAIIEYSTSHPHERDGEDDDDNLSISAIAIRHPTGTAVKC